MSKKKGFQKVLDIQLLLDRLLIWLGSKSRRLRHGSFIYRLDSLLINCWSFRVRMNALFFLNILVFIAVKNFIDTYIKVLFHSSFSLRRMMLFGLVSFSRWMTMTTVAKLDHSFNSTYLD